MPDHHARTAPMLSLRASDGGGRGASAAPAGAPRAGHPGELLRAARRVLLRSRQRLRGEGEREQQQELRRRLGRVAGRLGSPGRRREGLPQHDLLRTENGRSVVFQPQGLHAHHLHVPAQRAAQGGDVGPARAATGLVVGVPGGAPVPPGRAAVPLGAGPRGHGRPLREDARAGRTEERERRGAGGRAGRRDAQVQLQVPPPHPGPRGGKLPDGGGGGDAAAALPGAGVGVALPAGAAEPARRRRQADGVGAALPAAEGDPQASVRGPVPEERSAAAPVRLAPALPGGPPGQVQLLLPRGAEPPDRAGRHARADRPRRARLPRQDLLLRPQARRRQRVAGLRQPRLRELPGPRLPPPALVPRAPQGRGAVPRRGVPALGRAPAHALAQRGHDDGRPRRRAQRPRQGGALLRRQGPEHLLPGPARAALHPGGHPGRPQVRQGPQRGGLPAGDLRRAAQLQALRHPQAGLQGMSPDRPSGGGGAPRRVRDLACALTLHSVWMARASLPPFIYFCLNKGCKRISWHLAFLK